MENLSSSQQIPGSDIDPDILQTRNDILRAKDIFPPFGQPSNESKDSNANLQTLEQNLPENQQVSKSRTFPLPDFEAEPALDVEQNNTTENDDRVEFDLANAILANQRKEASAMRKGPSKVIAEHVAEKLSNLSDIAETDEKSQHNTHPQLDISQHKTNIAVAIDDFSADIPEAIINDISPGSVDFSFQQPNHNTSSVHISNITKTRLTRTQESIIAEIVAKDIEQFLKIA